MTISDYDAEELAAKLLGFGDEYEPEEVEQKLFDEYEISMDSFHKLICKLAPMCEVDKALWVVKSLAVLRILKTLAL